MKHGFRAMRQVIVASVVLGSHDVCLSQLPKDGVPSKEEMRGFFNGKYRDDETRQMLAMAARIRAAGERVLDDIVSLYLEYISDQGSTVPASCADHILRLARGQAATRTMKALMVSTNVRSRILVLEIASANGLTGDEYRNIARDLLHRHSEFSTQTGFSALELFLLLERFCVAEDSGVVLALLTKSDGNALDVRKGAARLLARIGDERSLATLRELDARWRRDEPRRIEDELNERKRFAEEGGSIWDPNSPAATNGLREDWLNSIGASITNLETRLRKEGRLPATTP